MIEDRLGEAAFLDFTRGAGREVPLAGAPGRGLPHRTRGVHRPRLGRVLRPLGLRQGADRLDGRGRATVRGGTPAARRSPTARRASASTSSCGRAASSPSRRCSAFDARTARHRSACRSARLAEPVELDELDGVSRRRSATNRWRVDVRAAGRAGAGGDRPRPRAARREPRQQRLEVVAAVARDAALHDARRDRPDERLRPVELHRRAVGLGAVVPRPVVHAVDDDRPAGRAYRPQQFTGGVYAAYPHRLPRPRGRGGRRRSLGDHREVGRQLRDAHRRAVGRQDDGGGGPQRAVGATRGTSSSTSSSLYLPPMHVPRGVRAPIRTTSCRSRARRRATRLGSTRDGAATTIG